MFLYMCTALLFSTGMSIPYRTRDEIEGRVPDRPPRCPEWLYKEIMIPCWDHDRRYRPSENDVLALIAAKRSLLSLVHRHIYISNNVKKKRAGNQ